MPELPEVETIKNDLSRKILHKKITSVEVKKTRLIKSGAKSFQKILRGNSFKKINRRGKLIYLELETGEFVLAHLRMTGQLIYQRDNKVIAGGHSYASFDLKLPNKYSYIIFDFSDGGKLFFNDMRTFGYMQLVDNKDLKNILAKYGIEPLTKDFSLKNFTRALKNKKTSIKSLLLNQKIISGIGNIYADEICFYAKILPNRQVSNLADAEIKKLWQGASLIIKKAIKHRGTTFNDYRDADGNKGNFIKYLKVFHRQGRKCSRCGFQNIKKTKQNGRGTHFCPNCQS